MCSINTVEIPKSCTSYIFWNVFEYCLRHYNMIVLGVYKRREDHRQLGEELWGGEKGRGAKSGAKGTKSQQKAKRKAYAGNKPASGES